MEQNSKPKWEAKVSTTLTKSTSDQIWSLFLDFFNIYKYFSTLTGSNGIHGTNGEPGCIRYCTGTTFRSKDCDGSTSIVSWTKERLISVDNAEMKLSYEIIDSNIGFENYVSTVKISPHGGGGCMIEWWFSISPVEGWAFEDLVKLYEVRLQSMALAMEDSLSSTVK